MRKAAASILVFALLLALALPLPAAMEAAGPQRPTTVLIIVSLDKKLPKTGKTEGMQSYLMTIPPGGEGLRFTSFPYNLAVKMPYKKGEAVRQLQFACKDLGPAGAAGVIAEAFGITIDQWVLVNTTALANLVDLAGGVEADLKDLAINKKGKDVRYFVDKPWKNVEAPGLQMLGGIQAIAYASDTLYGNPTIAVEEERFRERHEWLVSGIVGGLHRNGLDMLALIAAGFQGFGKNYMPGFPAETVLSILPLTFSASMGAPPAYLHVPVEIFTTEADNGWESLGYTEEDAAAVRAFIGQ